MRYVIGIALCLAGTLASAQPEDLDPVVKVKAARAQRDSQDLPPIPRGLTEPPPLPPPELHTHDIRRHRGSGSARARKGAAQSHARAKAQVPGKPAAGHASAHKGKAPVANGAKGGAKRPAAGQPKKS